MNNNEKFDFFFRKEDVYYPCVYLLLQGNEVVYVGQTRYGLKRIMSHFDEKKFDGFGIIRCEEENLDEKETFLIAKYNPIYNKTLTNAYSFKHIKYNLLKYYGKRIRKKQIVAFVKERKFGCYTFNGDAYLKKEDYDIVVKYFVNNY